MQISAMREYAERRGWTIAASIEDIGSGAKERPKRQALIKLARQRQVDVILVWRLDRWGRSLVDLIGSLQELSESGIGFVSITEALDLTTPAGRALAGMLAVFAEFERDILRERVRSGIAQAKKRGKILGRPRTIDAKSAEIHRLFSEGVNKHQIAKRLHLSHGSVFRTLEKANLESYLLQIAGA